MIRQIEIEGFKSIDRLKFKPGRVTVLIGENGCGKSNILEALAMAGAAAADQLRHEFLAPRGIRVTDSRLMAPSFSGRRSTQMAVTVATEEGPSGRFILVPQHPETTSGWLRNVPLTPDLTPEMLSLVEQKDMDALTALISGFIRKYRDERAASEAAVRDFLIYTPENTALRRFQSEGQILPLGIRGEGLFAHLQQLRTEVIEDISNRLKLIDWFDGFTVPADLAPGEHRLDIRDRYLDPLKQFDQRSANEGFLFLLFYFTLLISPDTPRFFAIDNVDASLNPRLCARLMKEIAALAEAHDKQVIVTTHNPAILDGLNLEDDDQRLFVVSRKPDGPTRIRRVKPPKPVEGEPPMRLSEAFIWGHLGGLPTNF